ncbi:MAG: hypothetical protein JKX76_01825 [Colwellia sp.]|nr:hypothetical protein [Colwellia sp.]
MDTFLEKLKNYREEKYKLIQATLLAKCGLYEIGQCSSCKTILVSNSNFDLQQESKLTSCCSMPVNDFCADCIEFFGGACSSDECKFYISDYVTSESGDPAICLPCIAERCSDDRGNITAAQIYYDVCEACTSVLSFNNELKL